MGWLRLVGFLKLQVSFAEYSLFYRSLLQKRPMILRSLLIVATLYLYILIKTIDVCSGVVRGMCMCMHIRGMRYLNIHIRIRL